MNRLSATIVCTCLCLTLASATSAQTGDLRLPVIIDADRTDYDGKTSMLMFSGLRLTQGSIGIEADTAHASRMDFDDSVWRFSGNVVFDVDAGHVTCDTADLEFSDFQLLVATIEGSPATFEFRRPDTAESTYAEASRLHYNVAEGTIEFSGGARIIEGGNQITSESLLYDINEQRINAVSSPGGEDRVTVTYTPPDADAATIQNDSEDNSGVAAESPGEDDPATDEDSTAIEDATDEDEPLGEDDAVAEDEPADEGNGE